MESMVHYWLQSLNLQRYFQNLVDNGYDDLETCKKIRAMDLYEFGVEEAGDRFRLMEAVKELQRGGATQVYIMAGTLPSPRHPFKSIQLSLLNKMIKMRLQNERIHLHEYPSTKQDFLPLALVQLSYRLSLALKVPMVDVEVVLTQLWTIAHQEITNLGESDCSPYSIGTLQYSRLPISCSIPHNLVHNPSNRICSGVSRSKSSDCSLSSCSSDSTSPHLQRSVENLLDVSSLLTNLKLKTRSRQRVAPTLNNKPKVFEEEPSYGFESSF